MPDNLELKDPFFGILHNENDDDGKPFYHLKPSTLYDFLNVSSRNILIPKYQRPYSWSKQNVKDLLDDISNLDRQGQWFLGPIFVIKNSSGQGDIKLLDGQQRTTTFILILLVIYRHILIIRNNFSTTINEDADDDLLNLYEQLDGQPAVLSNLLMISIQGQKKSRFVAEETVNTLLSNFIIRWCKETNDENKFKNLHKNFREDCDSRTFHGIPTAECLKDNFDFISKYISDLLDNSYGDIKVIEDFLHRVLYRLWVIEIPLQKENSSIRIFESLNNRGKPLTLIDKFRYRTLIDDSIINNDTKTTDVSKKWKEIYTLFAQTDEDKESFYQYFFMSKTGREISKKNHSEFFEIFESDYSGNEDKLHKFLDETTYFLKFLKVCKNNDTVIEEFLTIPDSQLIQKKEKIVGLFELSKRLMKYSVQTKMLFFKSLRSNDTASWTLISEMFKINRFTFWKVFHDKTPSNAFRDEILEMCGKSELLEDQLSDNRDRPNRIIKLEDKIPLSDNVVCHFLITFYTYLTESVFLREYSSEQVNNSQVEHMMPRAWKKHWSNADEFTIDDASQFIDGLISERKFEKLALDDFKNYLNNNDDGVEFVPKPYESAPFKNTNTVIEYIGNRWVMSLPKNKQGSNKDFAFKKNLFVESHENNGVRYPSDNSTIGINKYDNWSSKEILLRSFQMIDTIYENLSGRRTWDEFN